MTAPSTESQLQNEKRTFFILQGLPLNEASTLIVWAHGWGHDHRDFLPFAQSLSSQAAHLLLDFPGFGQASSPPDNWTTLDYADDVAKVIEPFRDVKKIIWVGHSFGTRVGLQFAAKYPQLVDGLFLVAGAGLQRKRGFVGSLKFWGRVALFKALKRLVLLTHGDLDALRQKFGTADYKTAGAMRPIFLTVIRENLTEEAKRVKCPACLVYGAADIDTPPEMGRRLAGLIPNAQLSLLQGHDHLSVLYAGRQLLLKRLVDFMAGL